VSGLRVPLLLLAIAAYFGVGLLWLEHHRERTAETPSPLSVHEAGPRGASLARSYLAARGRRVRLLGTALAPGEVPADAVVLRLAPGSSAGPLLTPGEETWLRRGGRLVIAIEGRYGPLQVERAVGPAVKVHPIWSGVRELQGEPLVLDGEPLREATTLFARGDRPVVSRLAVGAGELVLLAVPALFDNAHLGAADHLALLEALVGGRPVAFDEAAHGLQREVGLLELLLRFGLGPGLLLLALSGLLAFWRERVRIGPPAPDPEERRSDAVDLVDSIGALHDRALSRGEALTLYHQALSRTVALRSGLSGAALLARLRQLEGGPLPPGRGAPEPSPAAFAAGLARINDAFRRLHADSR
jgi:hypothetical protein